MADETVEAPATKKYIVAIERQNHPDAPIQVIRDEALGWGGNKGDVLPDSVVEGLSKRIAYVGNPITTLEQWLSIGWIKEA